MTARQADEIAYAALEMCRMVHNGDAPMMEVQGIVDRLLGLGPVVRQLVCDYLDSEQFRKIEGFEEVAREMCRLPRVNG